MSQIGKYFSLVPPAPTVETLTGNTGGAVPPTAGNINVVGDGTTVTVAGNPGTSTLTITALATGVTSITGDVGPAQTGAITLTGGTSGAIFTGAAGTITESFNFLSLPTTTATDGQILINGNAFLQNYNDNIFLGLLTGNFTVTGHNNICLGTIAGASLTTGQDNIGIGGSALNALNTGSNNVALGDQAMIGATSASGCIAIGTDVLSHGGLSGLDNIAIGINTGNNYTTNESYNILINNLGVIGESNVIRIGTNGSGADQQDACYIAGINGVNVGSVTTVVTEASNQLGTAVLTPGSGITITPGANTITIAATGTMSLTYTLVNTTPYTVLSTDEYLGVDSSGMPITVDLPNAPATGRVYIIKDSTGSAGTNNITVTTVGGVVNIDGATTFVMNTTYESIQVIFNGTSYEVF